jgi:hypothetical protein
MGQQLNYSSELKEIKGGEKKLKCVKDAKVTIIIPEVK